jgi:excisionase family DNA binding protein
MAQPERTTDDDTRDEALWNVRECAAYLKMSKSWIYKMADEGALPSARLGNRLRFHPARVREFAASLGEPSNVVPFRKR